MIRVITIALAYTGLYWQACHQLRVVPFPPAAYLLIGLQHASVNGRVWVYTICVLWWYYFMHIHHTFLWNACSLSPFPSHPLVLNLSFAFSLPFSPPFPSPLAVYPVPVTTVNISSLSHDKARIDWAVEYRHGDEEPDNITIYVENHDTQMQTSYVLINREWEAQSCVVDVVPGTEYWVRLQSTNEDGDHVTERHFFQSDPDGTYAGLYMPQRDHNEYHLALCYEMFHVINDD